MRQKHVIYCVAIRYRKKNNVRTCKERINKGLISWNADGKEYFEVGNYLGML